jgi:hypothetical protein
MHSAAPAMIDDDADVAAQIEYASSGACPPE